MISAFNMEGARAYLDISYHHRYNITGSVGPS